MSDLDFCKARLAEIAEHADWPDKLEAMVQEFMKNRMPVEPAHRAGLRAWARDELTKLELTPGGGVTKPVSTAVLAKTSRRMSTLQTVIREIDAEPPRPNESADLPPSPLLGKSKDTPADRQMNVVQTHYPPRS
jgi:hypothetical protein